MIKGNLNYAFIKKPQRSNSYLENYNRRIREVLGPYCSKKGISVIPWPLFLSFFIHEEEFYRNMLINLDNQELH